MKLTISARTPYICIDPATNVMYWTGAMYLGPIKFDEVGLYKFCGEYYTEQEMLKAFFPAIAAAPDPVKLKAQGMALRSKLLRK